MPADVSWLYSLLGNSLVIALVQLGMIWLLSQYFTQCVLIGFTSLLVPKAAELLASFKYDVLGLKMMPATMAIEINKTKVITLLVVDVTTVWPAPVIGIHDKLYDFIRNRFC